MAAVANNAIDVTQLSIDQLQTVLDRYTNDLQNQSAIYRSLKSVQAKFIRNGEDVNAVHEDNKDKELMVQLTPSIYVPAYFKDTENVLVDIGTGYYVSKTTTQAKKYFKRQAENVRKAAEETEKRLREAEKTRNAVSQLLQQKQMATKMQQEQQQEKSDIKLS